MPMSSYYGAEGMAWWMLVLGALVWLALAALAIWVVVPWLIRAMQRPTPQPPQVPSPSSQPSALDTLKARYARGELDTATFQAMRAQLDESAPIMAPEPKEPVPSGR
jgi:putative membrane protein